MKKYYYKKTGKKPAKIIGFFIFITGIFISFYVFFPLISWQVYFAPAFASQDITAPIPKISIVDKAFIQSLLTEATQGISGSDFTNAQNWFPNFKNPNSVTPKISKYKISIPKLDIVNAEVSTSDFDLTKHLVNYQGTAVPPDKGNAVIFGHSTLPWLFNQKDYKTIFADAYKMNIGDEIYVNIDGIQYKYKVEKIIVVNPENTTVMEQDYNDSFISLVTCTPPGTVWKRLVIKARMEKI